MIECWLHESHDWKFQGGRACPRGYLGCSQAVYRCRRCGEWDYGELEGPGHDDCEETCQLQ